MCSIHNHSLHLLDECFRARSEFKENNHKFHDLIVIFILEASRGAGAQSETIKLSGCGFDPHSRKWNIYLRLCFHFFALVSRQSAALSFATQHAMPPELGGKWGTECLNTKFLLTCCVRDTAWSWFIFYFIFFILVKACNVLIFVLVVRVW